MANDVYEVRLYWAGPEGKRWENVMYYQSNAEPTESDPFVVAQDIVDGFNTVQAAAMLVAVSTSVTLTAISARRVNNGGGPTYTQPINSPGTRTGDMMTDAVAFNLCSIPSAAPYQRKEGHVYLGGIVASDVVGDAIQSAIRVILLELVDALGLAISAAGAEFNLVLWDRTTQIARTIADWVIRPTISALKRRLRPRVA